MSPTVAELMARMPEAFQADKSSDLNAIVHFKFTGSEAGEWNAVIKDGACQVAQGIPHFKPTLTLKGDSHDFIRLFEGQLEPTAAFMDGSIELSGDANAALKVIQAFKF